MNWLQEGGIARNDIVGGQAKKAAKAFAVNNRDTLLDDLGVLSSRHGGLHLWLGLVRPKEAAPVVDIITSSTRIRIWDERRRMKKVILWSGGVYGNRLPVLE